jgi:hypothetical protein
MVRAAQQAGALTVTDGGPGERAAINFVVADNRVAFEVSLEAAERGGHRISSRMLAVATPRGAQGGIVRLPPPSNGRCATR